MTDDVEVLNKVLEDESGGKDYTVVTKHGEITYEMHRVSRVERQDFIDHLPDELVQYMREKANEKRNEKGVTEISSLDDISEAEPDEAPEDSEIDGDTIERMEDLIVESFQHDQITDRETRDFLEAWPDQQFYATSFLILAISSESEGVETFRVD